MEKDDVFRSKATNRNKRLFFTVPIAPSVNAIYTMRKKLTSRAQQYIRVARAIINLAIEEQHWKIPERSTWVYVDMVFYMPDRKIRDSHNTLKILMDVMQDIVFINDYFALPRIQSVEYDKDNPRIEVLVTHQNKIQREKGLKMTSI